eukprot:NODE_348_length_10403_cov_0.608210.p7 type:complete len:103 gc:universal NODE_348_length_10403_cov_0.608210:1685-1377(-)
MNGMSFIDTARCKGVFPNISTQVFISQSKSKRAFDAATFLDISNCERFSPSKKLAVFIGNGVADLEGTKFFLDLISLSSFEEKILMWLEGTNLFMTIGFSTS